MPQIKSSFVLNSSQPLDLRDSLTLNEMYNKGKNDVNEGHITYCKDGDSFYKGRYFVFMPNLSKNENTGYYREFTLNDIIVLENHNSLKNYDAPSLATGKLVYCKSDKMMYYNRYYSGAPNSEVYNPETGYFWKLVDLSSSDYVSTNSNEWKKLLHDVDKLNSNEIKVFETPEDLVDESNNDSEWLFSKGQLIYCKQLNSHCYNAYTQEDILNSDKEKLKGWFGYFKLLNTPYTKPDIKEPGIKIFPSDKDENWVVINRDGIDILVADINNINNAKPNIGPIGHEFDRGIIDYSNYIYFPSSQYNGKKVFDYVTGTFLLANLYKKDEDKELDLGDNIYYTEFNINSINHTQSPYKDMNGFDLERIHLITSNDIIFNYTKPLWASTDKTGLIEQPLVPWGDNMSAEFILVPTFQTNQMIKTPRPIKSLYIKMLGQYIKEDLDKWSQSTEGDNYVYTYRDGHRGEAHVKIEF